MSRIGWGIIGTGAIAKTYGRALAASETGLLAAVGSRSAESAERFGEEFGIDADRRHSGYEGLLADPAVRAVYISTPHPFHARWAIRAAEAGKHVLCEKPFALNHAEAMAVFEAVLAGGGFCMEAFMYRCHPQTRRLAELIRAGVIGEVRHVQAAFAFHGGFNPRSRLFSNALGGGGILDVGGYPVSMARLVAGAARGAAFADPVEVKGVGHVGETGVDEWAAAVMRFPGDVTAEVSTGVSVGQENRLRVYGSEGWILVPNPWQANRSAGEPGRILIYPKGAKEPREEAVECVSTSFALEADVAGRAIIAGRREAEAPAMTWEDTLGNMRALDAWRQSVGVVYELEKDTAPPVTVRGVPPAVRADHNMGYGRLEGVAKPISRLLMGVDNQRTFPHAAVMFDDFFERGGNAFDSAFGYGGGACERALGQWVKSRGVREQVVLLTKGAHTPWCDPANLTLQLRESLERLQTDYVDIYMMHRDNREIPVGEFIDVLNEHLRAGRIRSFGGSNWTIARFEAANEYAGRRGLTGFAALSNNLSLARMVEAPWSGCVAASDPESLAWHERTQTPLFSWSSQARGFFTERARPDDLSDRDLVRCWYAEDNFRRRERANEMAARRGVAPINIALAYVLCQPFPTFALIGPRTLAETRTSLPALDVRLDAAELKWLNRGE